MVSKICIGVPYTVKISPIICPLPSRVWNFGPYRRFSSQMPLFQLRSSLDLKSDIIKSKITNEKEKHLGDEALSSEISIDAKANPDQGPNLLNLDSIFVISIPITTHRSFIYCHHKPSLLSDKQRANVQWKVKAENRLVGLAAKGWNKLESSKFSVNQKIVQLVRRLLSSIPYDENSLRSFPSKSTMIREINEEHRELFPRAVMTSEVESDAVSVDQLKPIPVYHPQFQEPQAILDQVNKFRSSLTSYHKKWAVVCAIGIPLSLPMALIPVVPNVPGFYFAYRLYCHLQALRGADNLRYLLESTDDSVEDTTHLSFRSVSGLDKPYIEGSLTQFNSEGKEKLLINAEIIERLINSTGLHSVQDDLLRALAQESRRLQKDLEDQETAG